MAFPGHAHRLFGVRYLGLLATKTRPLSYLPITPSSWEYVDVGRCSE